mmetsp:Transcript_43867/g.86568  ORF Transcript_43867/g.86568 Transcript_43867/m.86568 type:complete len:124 (-) Transcript_43867:931-1302(-)
MHAGSTAIPAFSSFFCFSNKCEANEGIPATSFIWAVQVRLLIDMMTSKGQFIANNGKQSVTMTIKQTKGSIESPIKGQKMGCSTDAVGSRKKRDKSFFENVSFLFFPQKSLTHSVLVFLRSLN